MIIIIMIIIITIIVLEFLGITECRGANRARSSDHYRSLGKRSSGEHCIDESEAMTHGKVDLLSYPTLLGCFHFRSNPLQ
jgi:Na+/H+ antiporter NhaC